MREHNSLWKHCLRVPLKHVARVAALIRANKQRIEDSYAAQLEREFHESCRPRAVKVGKLEERACSVTVEVRHEDVRVNVLTAAIASVVPDHFRVLYPRWS